MEAFVTSAQFCYEPKTFTKNEVYPLKTRDKEKVRITLRFFGQSNWDNGGDSTVLGTLGEGRVFVAQARAPLCELLYKY